MCREVIRCELGAQCGPGGAHTFVLHSQQVWASAAFQGPVFVNLRFAGFGWHPGTVAPSGQSRQRWSGFFSMI